jgi:hypothetical protein
MCVAVDAFRQTFEVHRTQVFISLQQAESLAKCPVVNSASYIPGRRMSRLPIYQCTAWYELDTAVQNQPVI